MKYKKDDIVIFPKNKQIKVNDVWKKDEQRFDNIKSMGYNVCVIWEMDIKTNPHKILEILKNETQIRP